MISFHFFHSNNSTTLINDHFTDTVTTLTYAVVKSIVEFWKVQDLQIWSIKHTHTKLLQLRKQEIIGT